MFDNSEKESFSKGLIEIKFYVLQAVGSDDEGAFTLKSSISFPESKLQENDVAPQLSAEEIKACLEKLENEKVTIYQIIFFPTNLSIYQSTNIFQFKSKGHYYPLGKALT